MKQRTEKILLFVLTLAVIFNPLLILVRPDVAKADSASDAITNSVTDKTTALINISNQATYKYNQQKTYNSSFKSLMESSPYRNLLITMAKFSDSDSFITFDDLFTSGQEPKIIMNQNDLSALKSLYCLPNILPDFNENLDALYQNLPKDKKKDVDKGVQANSKFKSAVEYLSYLKSGDDSTDANTRAENSKQFDQLTAAAKANIGDDKIRQNWSEEISRLSKGSSPSVTLDTLVCITGISREQIVDYLSNNSAYLADKLKESIDSLTLDSRVLKTLVYLITPKNQGGAGHWRIRVQRLLQTSPQSSESDATIQTLAKKQATLQCDQNMTAAECGKQQGTTPDLEIENKDGTQYDAYLQSLTTAEDSYISERGLSAHAEGQAVDISEIDDIRCTKVVKSNLGSTKKYKQPIQPIKLVWQTTDGYNASGGSNTFDMMSLLKSTASDSVSNLLSSLNSDISGYDGDLSQANFDDIVQILGKSLLSNLLNAKSFNVGGFNIEDTLQKLGSVYVADYLGLPREIFINQNLTDIENLKYVIGRAAIEKKLGLPYGSLSGNNLPEILLSIGEKKLEHEMNLNAGDLAGFVATKDEAFALYIGRKVLEKELNLPAGSWPKTAQSFDKLAINSLKSSLIKNNPGQIDNQLNLGAGTTKNFVDNRTNSDDFAKTIGQKRLDDTLYGLKYFSINNAAYQLPGPTQDHPEIKDTWLGALNGEADSLTTIGVYTLARLLAPSNLAPESDVKYQKIRTTENGITTDISKEEFGRYVFREWLRGNLMKTGDECNAPTLSKSLDFDITSQGQIVLKGSSKVTNSLPSDPIMQAVTYSLVSQNINGSSLTNNFVISEENATTAGFEKMDIQRVLGCATGNSKAVFERIGSTLLYTGIANKLLSKDEKAKIDITNTNPDLRISNSTLTFYVERVTRSQQLIKEIKNNWKSFAQGMTGVDGISASINDLLDRVTNVFNDSDSTQAKAVKIQESVKNLLAKVDTLKGDVEIMKNINIVRGELDSKLQAANIIIADCNELVKVSSEIMAGKVIPSSDSLKMSQVSGTDLANAASNSSNTANDKNISPFKASSLIFSLVSGALSPKDLFVKFGANAAESQLGLPANSLVYLVENYERKGIDGVEAFFESIGQAKIEQAFSLPAYYFQAKSALASMPDFGSDAKSLAQYADKEKINQAISHYLSNNNITQTVKTIGSLPADITSVKSDQDIIQVLARMQADQWPDYNDLVVSAQTNWKTKQAASIKSISENVNVSSTTLQGVIDNIKSRNYNDALKTAEADLLLRLGLGGNYESLKDGSTLAWQKAGTTATSIDRKLNLKSGSTKALFTNDNLYSTSISQDEKNLMENNMQIGKNALSVYVKLLNGELSTTDLTKYKDQSFSADYVFENPYADITSSNGQCPVSFTLKDGFSINEASLQNNTFCYYDDAGRHCFKSPEEAQRYAALHKDQQYGDVLDQLAQKLSDLSSKKVSASTLKTNLGNFLNKKDTKFAFNSDETKNNQILTAIAENSKVDIEILRKLFTRQNPKATVNNYLLAAGKIAAQSLISTQLFKSAGLNVDPSLFGPEDLYKVLNGDLSSLYKVGTSYIDEAMNLKPGTVLSVFNAKDQIARDCNLNQIGGSIIAGLIGVDYFPLKGEKIEDFLPNLGESKVEQALNLPRGTFLGTSFSDVITKARAVNIALAFKVPTAENDKIIDDAALNDILGENYAAKILKTSQANKMQQIQNFMRSSLVLNSRAASALERINQKVQAQINTQIAAIKSGKNSNDFYNNLLSIDRLLGIKENSTLDLLAGQNSMTPDAYNKLVGTTTGTKLAAAKIGDSLGLTQNQSQAVSDLVNNINSIFKCQGSLIKVGNEEVCRTGLITDVWYHQWGKLYGNLNQIFTFGLDEKANLPEGTFQKIISNPDNTGAVLLEIGAKKIDEQLGLDSSKNLSFTNIYGKLTASGNQKDCLAEASGNISIQPLDLNLHNAEAALSDVNKKKPAQKQGQSNTDYQSSTEYKQWQENLKAALDAVNQAKSSLSSEINSRYSLCKVSIAQDSTDAQKIILEQVKGAINDKIHDYLGSITAKSEGKDVNIGVNMPNDDITALLDGDMRYFEAALTSLSVNYVTVAVDNIRTDNCGGESECKTAVPKEMRVTYDDIKTAMIGPTDVAAYQKAAWADVNGSYTNLDQTKVCDGDNCPQTGSGNFGDTLINALGQKDSTYSASDVVAGRVDDQYSFSQDNLKAKIASLNQQIDANKKAGAGSCQKSTGQASGSDFDSCLASYSQNNGDPEGQIDRLQNPQKYYDPNGANFTAKNNDTLNDIKATIKKVGLENLQYKMMDMALWKLDENAYPGMAKDLIKGNTEIKTAALARYIKNGLANGHLFGVKFDAVNNVQEWTQVVAFGKNLLSGDPQAFTRFASGDGFNFLGDYISKNSNNTLGFNISPDLAKGILVGLGTGDWGLKSINLDTVAKNTNTTHSTTLANGKTVNLPTVGGVITTTIAQNLFSWADKALGLKAGQTYELFKMGAELYKTWKIYDEISKAKDIAELSEGAKQFMASRHITDLNEAKSASEESMAALKANLAYKVTSILVEKLLGNQIAGVEDDLGMVPGTLTPLVTVAVYNFVVAPLFGLGPVGWTAAVVIAVAGWVFGSKTYYYCTADGYYPEIGSAKPGVNDTTGMGVWGGRITSSGMSNMSSLMQKKAVESAQNKARKLIQNMLWIQKSSKFDDADGEPVVPIQIMTARKEDVDYFDNLNLISSNMCQPRLGQDSISCGGICGSAQKSGCKSESRMGIWANPQTIAWTHIGF